MLTDAAARIVHDDDRRGATEKPLSKHVVRT